MTQIRSLMGKRVGKVRGGCHSSRFCDNDGAWGLTGRTAAPVMEHQGPGRFKVLHVVALGTPTTSQRQDGG